MHYLGSERGPWGIGGPAPFSSFFKPSRPASAGGETISRANYKCPKCGQVVGVQGLPPEVVGLYLKCAKCGHEWEV